MQHKPSQTAAWVAMARTAGRLLPKEQQLAFDPYGPVFVAGPLGSAMETLSFAPELARVLLPRVAPLHAFLLWMQLRTRAIDDVLSEFLQTGGRQVVLLGAGYDARAIRLAHVLKDARLFEIDHPATQTEKRAAVAAAELRTSARYIAWDFEQGYDGLLDALQRQGLDSAERVLTLWEGVTMYLSAQAISQTLSLVKSYGGAGSWLCFTYVDERVIATPQGDQRITQRLVRRVGEPHRFGFAPQALPSFLREHGYTLLRDHTDYDLALHYLNETLARHYRARDRHVALAAT